MFLKGERRNQSDATQSFLASHGDIKLPPEIEKGNVEYKLKLVDPTPERIEHLITQLKWRLAEGMGECLYEIGVTDKGTLVGLNEKDMKASMKTLQTMASALQAELSVVRRKEVAGNKMIAEILFRKCLADDQQLLEIRVAILGAADAGKSSLLGVLCYEELDNGRGLARLNLLRHRHEIESGRSSAIAREIIGFTAHGKLINYASSNVSSWEQIASQAAKVVTFMDTCGHPKYQKTTIGGLTGDSPDFACVILSANYGGLPDVSKEHIILSKLLNVPLMICITKIDSTSASELTKTLEALLSFLKSPGMSKLPVVIQNEDDLGASIPLFVQGQIIPLFLMSSVTGDNFDLLRKLFNLLPKPSSIEKVLEREAELQIQDIYRVDGNTIVGGIMTQGQFQINSSKHSSLICWLGPDNGKFIPVLLTSIYRQRCAVRYLQGGHAGTICIKFLDRDHQINWENEKILPRINEIQFAWKNLIPDTFKLRRGQILAAFTDSPPEISSEIKVDLLVVSHPTGLQIGNDLTLHCGSVICSVKIVDIGDEIATKLLNSPATPTPQGPLNFENVNNSLPSPISPTNGNRKKRRRMYSGTILKQGESGSVTFRIMNEPEVILIGASVVIRGPEIKSVGKVIAHRFI